MKINAVLVSLNKTLNTDTFVRSTYDHTCMLTFLDIMFHENLLLGTKEQLQ